MSIDRSPTITNGVLRILKPPKVTVVPPHLSPFPVMNKSHYLDQRYLDYTGQACHCRAHEIFNQPLYPLFKSSSRVFLSIDPYVEQSIILLILNDFLECCPGRVRMVNDATAVH